MYARLHSLPTPAATPGVQAGEPEAS
jgi:hypothetical protein